jgi:hypothetical protein
MLGIVPLTLFRPLAFVCRARNINMPPEKFNEATTPQHSDYRLEFDS